jgi:hypothetical protein
MARVPYSSNRTAANVSATPTVITIIGARRSSSQTSDVTA